MKKILTVSLFAMMAVSAANADIASTDYVGKQITATAGALDELKTTAKGNLVGAINEVRGQLTSISETQGGNISSVQQSVSDLTDVVNAMDAAYKAADTTTLSSAKSYADAEDKKIEDTIGTVPADKTVVGMIAEAQTAATYDDTAVRGLISDNADEINTIKSSAYATSGITKAKVDTYDGYDAKITAAQTSANNAKTAADNAQTDVDALETTVSAMDAAYKAADTTTLSSAKSYADAEDKKIEDTIGTVPADKTVVGMIAEAQTAATYDDTAVRGLISGNTNEISAIKSSAYATSGITKAKVDTYDGYDAKITAAKKAGDDAQTDVDALKTTVSDMDTAYKLADTNIKNTIGDVASDKTVVGMIADAKSGAVTEAANDAKTKYQVKSTAAYTIGTTGGGWTDLKSLTGYSKTGTFSLVLKNDVLQWEAVNY